MTSFEDISRKRANASSGRRETERVTSDKGKVPRYGNGWRDRESGYERADSRQVGVGSGRPSSETGGLAMAMVMVTAVRQYEQPRSTQLPTASYWELHLELVAETSKSRSILLASSEVMVGIDLVVEDQRRRLRVYSWFVQK
ncbi:hypothetical protein ANO14919_087000 [Xylariales sp. No.14919]|nr:hypothetical protein ANO14919_087000 [Xylariales sp. No.14919]